MKTLTRAIFTIVGCLVLVLWVFSTPSTTIPVGVAVSDGGSMGSTEPNLNVYIKHDPSAGDIVVFREDYPLTDSDWVVHRVVAETDGGYLTKGDANDYTDQSEKMHFDPVTSKNLAGVVVFRAPLFHVGGIWGFVTTLATLLYIHPTIQSKITLREC